MEKLPQYLFFETNVLQRAIATGSLRKVRFLLNRGSQPNTECGPDCLRPLMLACYIADEKRRNEVIEVLLQAGAVPGLPDASKRCALYYTCWLGLESTFDILLQAYDSDLTRGDKEGNTCLHICAKLDRLEQLRKLVYKMKRYGIDLNTKNNSGQTALTVAYCRGNMECFGFLHGEGALPHHHWEDMMRKLSAREADSGEEIDSFTQFTDGQKHVQEMQLPSNAIIKLLLVKTAHKKHFPDVYRPHCLQSPINAAWVESVKDCRPRSSEFNFAAIASTAIRLKSIRSKISLQRQQSIFSHTTHNALPSVRQGSTSEGGD